MQNMEVNSPSLPRLLDSLPRTPLTNEFGKLNSDDCKFKPHYEPLTPITEMRSCSLLRSILLCFVCLRVAYSLRTSAEHSEVQAANALQKLRAWLLQPRKAQGRHHYSEAAAADRVINLPGLEQPFKSDLYSG